MSTRLNAIGSSCALVVVMAASAHATPLQLHLSLPDLTSGLVSVSYNSGTLAFLAHGTALSLDLNGQAPPEYSIANGIFEISGTINHGGGLGALNLNIHGTIAALPASDPLLTGSATAFGFSSSPLTQTFEFIFNVTGGALAGSGTGHMGSVVGVILDLGNGFAGSFEHSFSNSGFGASDTAPLLPAPGPATLAGLAMCALARRRR